MEDEILEVVILLNYLIDRKGDSTDSFPSHVVSHLIFFRDKIGNLDKITYFIDVVDYEFVLGQTGSTFCKF